VKRVKQLGNVIFQMNSMFVTEEFSPNDVYGEHIPSAAGNDIVFIQPNYTPPITLESKSYGYLTDAQRQEIVNMWHNYGAIYQVTYTDDTTDDVQFRYDQKPTFAAISEGGCYFTATIPLLKITT